LLPAPEQRGAGRDCITALRTLPRTGGTAAAACLYARHCYTVHALSTPGLLLLFGGHIPRLRLPPLPPTSPPSACQSAVRRAAHHTYHHSTTTTTRLRSGHSVYAATCDAGRLPQAVLDACWAAPAWRRRACCLPRQDELSPLPPTATARHHAASATYRNGCLPSPHDAARHRRAFHRACAIACVHLP